MPKCPRLPFECFLEYKLLFLSMIF